MEIEREREVIREEILMYRDHPAQHAQELLTADDVAGHPLGRPLTGTVETIGRLEAPRLPRLPAPPLQRRHHHRHRRRSGLSRARRRMLAPALRAAAARRTPRFLRSRPQDGPRASRLFTQETEQTHLAMGFHAFGRADERRFALKLLSASSSAKT